MQKLQMNFTGEKQPQEFHLGFFFSLMEIKLS